MVPVMVSTEWPVNAPSYPVPATQEISYVPDVSGPFTSVGAHSRSPVHIPRTTVASCAGCGSCPPARLEPAEPGTGSTGLHGVGGAEALAGRIQWASYFPATEVFPEEVAVPFEPAKPHVPSTLR